MHCSSSLGLGLGLGFSRKPARTLERRLRCRGLAPEMRRHYPRLTANGEFYFFSPSQAYHAQLDEVSLRGLSFRSHMPFPTLERGTLRILLPFCQELQTTEANIVWISSRETEALEDGRQTIGLRYLGASRSFLTALGAYLLDRHGFSAFPQVQKRLPEWFQAA